MYITFSLILFNQFTLFRLSEKDKKLVLLDDVKGFLGELVILYQRCEEKKNLIVVL